MIASVSRMRTSALITRVRLGAIFRAGWLAAMVAMGASSAVWAKAQATTDALVAPVPSYRVGDTWTLV